MDAQIVAEATRKLSFQATTRLRLYHDRGSSTHGIGAEWSSISDVEEDILRTVRRPKTKNPPLTRDSLGDSTGHYNYVGDNRIQSLKTYSDCSQRWHW